MTHTHTPGPWRIDGNDDLPLAVIEDNEDGTGICEIGERTPLNLANAALIAAAPEMLAALQLIADSVTFTGMSQAAPLQLDAVIKVAKAAIARATGQD